MNLTLRDISLVIHAVRYYYEHGWVGPHTAEALLDKLVVHQEHLTEDLEKDNWNNEGGQNQADNSRDVNGGTVGDRPTGQGPTDQ